MDTTKFQGKRYKTNLCISYTTPQIQFKIYQIKDTSNTRQKHLNFIFKLKYVRYTTKYFWSLYLTYMMRSKRELVPPCTCPNEVSLSLVFLDWVHFLLTGLQRWKKSNVFLGSGRRGKILSVKKINFCNQIVFESIK